MWLRSFDEAGKDNSLSGNLRTVAWILVIGMITFFIFHMIVPTRSGKNSALINVFPRDETTKNYRLTGQVSYFERKKGFLGVMRETIYYIEYIDWPNGGRSDFEETCVTKSIYTPQHCVDQNENEFRLEVDQIIER